MRPRTGCSAKASDLLGHAPLTVMQKPVAAEIPYVDPLAAFAPFAADPYCAFLDSAVTAGGRGRYSYICVDPVRVLAGSDVQRPFQDLRNLLGEISLTADPNLPPFQTGLCGVLGYELGGTIERLPPPKQGVDFPVLSAALYDTIVAFDTVARRAWVIGTDLTESRTPVADRVGNLVSKLAETSALPAAPTTQEAAWSWQLSSDEYRCAVADAIEYIYAGDIFQANITARADTPLPNGVSPFDLYRRLRHQSPAPFAAYLRCGEDATLVSASPERFLRVDAAGRISTRPIKGTRPRGTDAAADAALAAELKASPKDRAENLMIVDLLRNDLSRVAEIGSVEVSALCELETFARVHHLVSEVNGVLRTDKDIFDLLIAAFPGGSVTGAPKVRAMEIIHELEPVARGPYCGSVFWAGADGQMDSSIVIRSLAVAGDTVHAHAGGGIVADSEPERELDEMLTKAGPLLASVGGDGAS